MVKGDKHSLYSKHMKEHGWRVGAQSFDAWGRRVAADIGAERALYMTDDPRVMSALESSGDDFFRLVPAPRNCMPSYAAGVLGKHARGEADGEEEAREQTVHEGGD